MKLYLIRHAIAEERSDFALTGQPDEKRPLTEKGIEKMKKITQGFYKIEDQIDLIYQSPLTRSQQTAEIIKEFYPDAKLETTEHLSPGFSAKELFSILKKQKLDSVALVGHEPDLGQFLSWLMFRQASDHFPFKKGGIAKVDFYGNDPCYLKWFLQPKLI